LSRLNLCATQYAKRHVEYLILDMASSKNSTSSSRIPHELYTRTSEVVLTYIKMRGGWIQARSDTEQCKPKVPPLVLMSACSIMPPDQTQGIYHVLMPAGSAVVVRRKQEFSAP